MLVPICESELPIVNYLHALPFCFNTITAEKTEFSFSFLKYKASVESLYFSIEGYALFASCDPMVFSVRSDGSVEREAVIESRNSKAT